jgi:Protein of unknown function (DUF3551)
MMKPLLLSAGFAGVTLVVLTGLGTPAQAQNYPWCVVSSAYEGGQNCGFSTFDQCMATRLGIGGFCVQNTQYRPAVSPAPASRKTHRD